MSRAADRAGAPPGARRIRRLLAAAAALWASAGPVAHAAEFLYWGGGGFTPGQIIRAPLSDASQTFPLPARAEAVTVLAIDTAGERLFWTGDGTLYRSNLHGTEAQVVASTGAFSEGLALDIANQHVYWTNWNGEIRRANTSGTQQVLLRTETHAVYGLALDLTHGRMYWAADDNAIHSANLDGSDPQLVAQGGDEPLGVAVDPAGGKVYWAEWGSQTVRRTDLDGLAPPETLYTSPTGQPIGIAVDAAAGKLYWSEWTTNALRRANLDGSGLELLATAHATPWGLAPGPAPPGPPIVQLTRNLVIDTAPDVDAGQVVWEGTSPGGTREIFRWEGGVTDQVTPDGTHERRPHVSGANLAWISQIDDDGEIFFSDGSTPIQVSDDVLNHSNFCMDGDRVAFTVLDGSDLDVVVWEGGATTQLTHDNDLDGSPCISGERVIWAGRVFGGSDTEIFLWDGQGEVRLTDNGGDDDVPVLDGPHAAWMTWDAGDWHITFWNGATATRIDSPATNERFPDLSGRRVVWSGQDGTAANDTEIYLWDDGTLVQLTDNETTDLQPRISGNQVVWVSYVDGDPEIFLATLPSPPAVPALSARAGLGLALCLAFVGALAARWASSSDTSRLQRAGSATASSSCPASGYSEKRFQPGSASNSARASTVVTRGSRSPWRTRVGTRTERA